VFLAVPALAGIPSPETQSVSPAPPNLPFAFSDLDGDLRPDVAVVETGRSDRSYTDYWVQLQLTAAAPQSIRVIAPTGGLRIAARDVNGDLFPDLVLTTSWPEQPVAILLNDGHGSFSVVEPGRYPGAFRCSGAGWTTDTPSEPALLVVLSQAPTAAGFRKARFAYPGSESAWVRRHSCEFSLAPILSASLGRAPPLELLLPKIQTSQFGGAPQRCRTATL
jgi:hypothetical protein